MTDHNNQLLSAREMVRAHAYPLLAAVRSLSLFAIALLFIPQAIRNHRFNRCVDAQIQMRDAINPGSQQGPGRINEHRGFQHCEGR